MLERGEIGRHLVTTQKEREKTGKKKAGKRRFVSSFLSLVILLGSVCSKNISPDFKLAFSILNEGALDLRRPPLFFCCFDFWLRFSGALGNIVFLLFFLFFFFG